MNLETDNLSLRELPQSDMIIATGCIGYIGYRTFSNVFELIKKQDEENLEHTNLGPILAFSVLRIFDMADIEKTFDHYGYSYKN